MIGALDDFRDARGILDLRRPFGRGTEKSGIVHLLKCAAPEHAALDLADEENQRNRIMLRDMHAMGRVGRAGPAGHKADPRAIDEPGVGDRHHRGPRLLPADRDRQGGVMHRVERGQVRFAGHTEDMLGALRDELVDEDLAAGPAVGELGHRGLLAASCSSPALRGRGVGVRVTRGQPERSENFPISWFFKPLRPGKFSPRFGEPGPTAEAAAISSADSLGDAALPFRPVWLVIVESIYTLFTCLTRWRR